MKNVKNMKKMKIDGSTKLKVNISGMGMALLVLIVVLSSVAIYEFVQLRYGSAYQKALAAQDPNDICATPPGYTDEEWRTHMGHHPDTYAQCLK